MKSKEARIEAHGLKDKELGIALAKARADLYALRSKRVSEAVEKTNQFRVMRKDIARMLTEQRAREIKAEHKAAGGKPSEAGHRKPVDVKATPAAKKPSKMTSSLGPKKAAAKRAPSARKRK